MFTSHVPSLLDYPNGGNKRSDLGSNGNDASTDDRKDTSDLGLEVVQQISTAAGMQRQDIYVLVKCCHQLYLLYLVWTSVNSRKMF